MNYRRRINDNRQNGAGQVGDLGQRPREQKCHHVTAQTYPNRVGDGVRQNILHKHFVVGEQVNIVLNTDEAGRLNGVVVCKGQYDSRHNRDNDEQDKQNCVRSKKERGRMAGENVIAANARYFCLFHGLAPSFLEFSNAFIRSSYPFIE